MTNIDDYNMVDSSFQIITYAGNARSTAMEALVLSREGKYEEALEKYEEAKADFLKAHQAQTDLLVKNANGTQLIPDILLVHAQDHFIAALVCLELCQEMTRIYKKIES